MYLLFVVSLEFVLLVGCRVLFVVVYLLRIVCPFLFVVCWLLRFGVCCFFVVGFGSLSMFVVACDRCL